MKNKILCFSLIFILLLCSLSSMVFADTSDIVFSDWGANNDAYVDWIANLPECKSGEYYIFQGWANFQYDGNNYVVFINKEYFDTNNIKAYLKFESSTGLYYLCFSEPCYTCECYTGSRYCQNGKELRSQSIRGFVGNTSLGCYTTLPVIYRDNSFSSNSVFSGIPPLEPTITQTLVETTIQVQIAEQLKIMIVGFLKYLIVLVISLIAFWKVWQFHSMQLKKA